MARRKQLSPKVGSPIPRSEIVRIREAWEDVVLPTYQNFTPNPKVLHFVEDISDASFKKASLWDEDWSKIPDGRDGTLAHASHVWEYYSSGMDIDVNFCFVCGIDDLVNDRKAIADRRLVDKEFDNLCKEISHFLEHQMTSDDSSDAYERHLHDVREAGLKEVERLKANGEEWPWLGTLDPYEVPVVTQKKRKSSSNSLRK